MGKNRLGQKILDFYAQRYQDLAGVPKLEPYPSIGEMLAYLATVPDYVVFPLRVCPRTLKGKSFRS